MALASTCSLKCLVIAQGAPTRYVSAEGMAAHPRPDPDSFHHSGSKPPPVTQITAARQQESPEQNPQCPLPEAPAGSFSGHLCRPALSLPNLGWRGPRERPGNIFSGVMFNLDSSPPPAGAPCPAGKGILTILPPSPLCPHLPAGSLQFQP